MNGEAAYVMTVHYTASVKPNHLAGLGLRHTAVAIANRLSLYKMSALS